MTGQKEDKKEKEEEEEKKLAHTGRDQSKVVQEVLADLKIIGLLHFLQLQLQFTVFDHSV